MIDVEGRRNRAQKKLARADRGDVLCRMDPFTTAIHEAAHCVFEEGFGLTVKWATCMPSTSAEYGFQYGHAKSNADEVALPGILHIAVSLAGEIAEHKLENREPLSWRNLRMSSDDLRSIQSYLSRMKSDGSALHSMFEDTVKLVTKADSWIRMLGIELYAHQRLTGEQIRELLRGAGFYENNPFTEYREYSESMNRYHGVTQRMLQAGVSQEQIAEFEDKVRQYYESLSSDEKQQFVEECRRAAKNLPLTMADDSVVATREAA